MTGNGLRGTQKAKGTIFFLMSQMLIVVNVSRCKYVVVGYS